MKEMYTAGEIRVKALWYYPVKSLAGIALPQAQLTAQGIAGDREWMIVDSNGIFATQRKYPALATVQVEVAASGMITLHNRGESVTVPETESEARPVRVWQSHCVGFAAKPEINWWLTEQAQSKTPLQLVAFDKRSPRPLARDRFGQGTTHFADAAPYLVTNSASLSKLNAALKTEGKHEVTMNRFRPNIVIEGLAAFHEHRLRGLRDDQNRLLMRFVDPCQRCSVITVDPSTGTRSPKALPFNTLTRLNAMPHNAKAPAFGVNATLERDATTLRVGDILRCV